MLQLPQGSVSPPMKAGTPPTAENPKVIEYPICPVLKLLAEHHALLAAYNKIDTGEYTDEVESDLAEIQQQMDAIVTQAIDLSPTSFDGAMFQLLLAFGESNAMVRGATLIDRDDAHERFTRYMCRAMDRFGKCFDWPETRAYFCPPYSDPRKEGAK